MENTKENKGSFFGQYLGQEVLSHPEYNGEIVLIDNFFINYNIIDDGYFLELKSLSSISADEYLEIGQITNVDVTDNSQLFEFAMDIISEAYINGDSWIHNSTELKTNDISFNVILAISDYLRSKGYALPFMGLSVETLIDYGWVRLKT